MTCGCRRSTPQQENERLVLPSKDRTPIKIHDSSGTSHPVTYYAKKWAHTVQLLTLDDSTSSSCKSPRLGTLRDRGTLSSPARLQVSSPHLGHSPQRPTRPKKGTPCQARKCVPMHRVTVHAVQDLNSRVRKLGGFKRQ